MDKPIAITLGDPAGIGPEIIAKAFRDAPGVTAGCLVAGDVASMRRAIEIDRAIGYAHALGHDLVELANLHQRRGAAAEAQMALEEAQVWFGFTEDTDALEATRARLAGAPPAGGAGTVPQLGLRIGIKSHLSLGEGKVYCAFESPARGML